MSHTPAPASAGPRPASLSTPPRLDASLAARMEQDYERKLEEAEREDAAMGQAPLMVNRLVFARTAAMFVPADGAPSADEVSLSWRVYLKRFAMKTLVSNWSPRWEEATSTALLGGGWGRTLVMVQDAVGLAAAEEMAAPVVGQVRAEARAVHRQLVPVWRRRTRHGRVLSLDAALGDGLSLYDLVATEIDLLARVAGGVFEDNRLNAVLRALNPAERQVVFARAEGDARTTWAEAAATAGAADPQAFGDHVRRRAQRLAEEQRRRAVQRRIGPAAH